MKAKVTLTLDEDLLPKAKRYARSQNMSLSELVENALRKAMTKDRRAFSIRWRGKFRPADRKDERYRQLSKKYL